MRAKLFVGNLPWGVDDVTLEEVFREHGEVTSARVITDRETGRSRGFGFVEIEANDIAAVIEATNGYEVMGRPLRVNEAEDRNDRGGSGGGGFRRGGGGGGGYGGGDRGGYGGGDRGGYSGGGDRGSNRRW